MFVINVSQVDELQKAMKNYPADAEKALNEVLHNQASELMQESIKRMIPVSGREWAGKKRAASKAKSLKSENSNLAVTVKSTSSYGYLYFPDDGSNTKRHAGNKQFFYKGTESVQDEIIERCITRLIKEFND